MFNIKILLLIMGLFLMTFGYINNQKGQDKNKYVYKVFPRNVYDEIYMSMPSLEYNDELYNKINMTYMLNDYGDYRNLYEKPVKRCNNPEYRKKNNTECKSEFKPFISESERIHLEDEMFDKLSIKQKFKFLKNRSIKNDKFLGFYKL